MPVVFVSYAGPDTAWAEWVAWQLQEAGHTVVLSQWHLRVENFVAWIDEALNASSIFVALCSAAYIETRWTRTEWHAAVAMAEPTNGALGIVVVRLDETQPPPLLRPYPRCDLAWQTADDARALLLNTVDPEGRPSGPPAFPGIALPRPEPRLPRQLPQVWGPVPARNVGFTGRHRLLADLRGLLDGDGGRGRQALCGPGGAGKSQLAAEYAWRFAHDYDAVWWVDAQSPELIGKQLADFSAEWERIDPRQAEPTVETLWQRCKHNARWLLIFDNVAGEEAVLPWLPPVPGRVMLTSRSPSWREAAGAVRLDGFERAESVELLSRVEGLTEQDCEQLARELDDLPLAVVQAAGVLDTGTAASEYLLQLRTSAAELLGEGRPPSYPVTLAASVHISAARLSAEDIAAGQLLALCAGMAPAPIPVSWLQAAAADALPVPLAEAIGSPGRFRLIRSRLVHLGLAKASSGQLQLHRLTQRILHDTSKENADGAAAVVCAVRPASRSDWVELLPHLEAVAVEAGENTSLARSATDAVLDLVAGGEPTLAHQLATVLHEAWHNRLGPDHLHTLWAAVNRSTAARALDLDHEAAAFDEDTFRRTRQLLGENAPQTLVAATNWAIGLGRAGDHNAALALGQKTLARYQEVLGPDDSRTLQCAQNVAAELRALQRLAAAIDLGADTLTRRRRVLGDDHPDTIVSQRALRRDCLRILRELRCQRMTDDAMAPLTAIGLVPGLRALEHTVVADSIAAAVRDQRSPITANSCTAPGRC